MVGLHELRDEYQVPRGITEMDPGREFLHHWSVQYGGYGHACEAHEVYGLLTHFFPDWLLLTVTRLIRQIHAVPYRRTPESRPGIQILVTRNNLLPFLPPLKRTVPVDEIYLARRLKPAAQVIAEDDRAPFQKLVESLAEIPLKSFLAAKHFVTREQYVPVRIKSNSWALSLHEEGWQWENNGLEKVIGTTKKF